VSYLSFTFAVFVGVTLLAFYLAPARFRQHVLLAMSCLFYATHEPVFALPLLLAVTYGVHRVALAIDAAEAEREKWRLSVVSVTALVIVLAGFKLLGSAASSGTEQGLALRLLIPLGISYYLFKLIAYLLEVYWGNLRAEHAFVRVALYAAFFPQVVSGPIQRPGAFFEQAGRLGEPDSALVSQGLRRILFGLFKKIAIADHLSVPVDAVFGDPTAWSSLELVLGGYLFALQLYADFSGVTDIAIGLGKLVGITGPENFSLPFFARNLQEYWRRWHQSLTSWLADYLFTPLSLALRGQGQVGLALAILVNMFTVGIWHGIGSSYAAFGLYHGVCLVISVFTLRARDRFFRRHVALAPVRAVMSRLVTFHLVVVGLVLFRAPTLGVSYKYFATLVQGVSGTKIAPARIDFNLLQLRPNSLVMILLLVAVAEVIHWARTQPNLTSRFLEAPRVYRWAAYYTMIVVTLAFTRIGDGKFIYAQF
jgi:alginate O-acetyltransferase complex protein AlgI